MHYWTLHSRRSICGVFPVHFPFSVSIASHTVFVKYRDVQVAIPLCSFRKPEPAATSLSSMTCLSPHVRRSRRGRGPRAQGPRHPRTMRPSTRQAEANHSGNKEANYSIPFRAAAQVRWLRPYGGRAGGRYCPTRGPSYRPRPTPVFSRARPLPCPSSSAI